MRDLLVELEATAYQLPEYLVDGEWGGDSPGTPVERGPDWTVGWHTRSPRFGRCAPAVSFNGSPAGGGYLLRGFDLDDVEAVEVYRGKHVPLELGRAWE